eukprot:TRINITY_DN2364_c0_g1_i1.p1 TRINITY_DN2364_c0_g1~~TRINITY_DN2364_c0_g1_i1.p1  ORF type:complete len:264 (-),score=42.61 TRINITY_DN2364_c0_g1_i1:56-847(-)
MTSLEWLDAVSSADAARLIAVEKDVNAAIAGNLWSPLSCAAYYARLHVVQHLLAQPSVEVNHVPVEDPTGLTPLLNAITALADPEAVAIIPLALGCVKELLKNPQIDVNRAAPHGPNAGMTPLGLAIQLRSVPALKELLAHPTINVNLPCRDGLPVEMALLSAPASTNSGGVSAPAVRQRQRSITQLVLAHRDVELRDDFERVLAANAAKERKNPALVAAHSMGQMFSSAVHNLASPPPGASKAVGDAVVNKVKQVLSPSRRR